MAEILFDWKAVRPEVREKFIHASGPGGQNVNKVATCVQLIWDLKNSHGLSDAPKKRLLAKLDSRGQTASLVITAQRFRSREKNREDAWNRLHRWITQGLKTAKPRKATRPTLASRKKRLEVKAKAGEKKAQRQKIQPP